MATHRVGRRTLIKKEDLAGFDQRFARDLEKRSADFERMLIAEFGETAVARCFRFDAANVIGLVASAVLGLGGPLVGQLTALLAPLILERAATFATGLKGDRLRALSEQSRRLVRAPVNRRNEQAIEPVPVF